MARDTVDSRIGRNLKSSNGVAVGPEAISREPAAWARGATTAALLFLRMRFFLLRVDLKRDSEFFIVSIRSRSSCQRRREQHWGAGKHRGKEEEREKERKKETSKKKTWWGLKKKGERKSRLPPWLVFFLFLFPLFASHRSRHDSPGATRGDRGPDGHLRGQGESHSVRCWCKGELRGSGECVRGG